MQTQKYSFWQSFLKMVIKVGAFAVPILIAKFPTLASVSIGGALYMVLDWAQKKYTNI